jgi:hypothetical protein
MKSTIRFTAALTLAFAVRAQAQNVSQLRIESGMVFNDAVAFQFPATGHFNIEPMRQQIIESRLARGWQGWALIDSASRDILTISSTSDGQKGVDSAEWRTQFEREVAGEIKSFPNAQDFASKNEWGKDTATYRFSFQDDHGRYHSSICRGTGTNRLKPAVVCVNAATKVKGSQDQALNGLTITVPYDAAGKPPVHDLR